MEANSRRDHREVKEQGVRPTWVAASMRAANRSARTIKRRYRPPIKNVIARFPTNPCTATHREAADRGFAMDVRIGKGNQLRGRILHDAQPMVRETIGHSSRNSRAIVASREVPRRGVPAIDDQENNRERENQQPSA